MDAVIEVKGSASTVTVSWENDKEGESDDLEKTNSGSDQMTAKEMIGVGEAFTAELLFHLLNVIKEH